MRRTNLGEAVLLVADVAVDHALGFGSLCLVAGDEAFVEPDSSL